MSYSFQEMQTPCEWKKSQTCRNKGQGCKNCNQTHERKGLTIFADPKIKDNYSIDQKRLRQFEQQHGKG